jgi:alpha-tubulin suppressor-like RCC1 family protein
MKKFRLNFAAPLAKIARRFSHWRVMAGILGALSGAFFIPGADAVYNLGAFWRRATPAVTGLLTVALAKGKLSVGSSDTCAVYQDGTGKCWGTNNFGQLGNGGGPDTLVPVSISGLTTAIGISSAVTHTCAVLSDGTAKCWGLNNEGRLGTGNTSSSGVPVAVTGLTSAVEIFAAGQGYGCARLSGGTIQCWGAGSFGQLGNGGTADSTVPVSVTGISTAVGISGGYYYACAVLADGTVRCWGQGANGQLGNGGTSNSSVPVVVSGLTGAVAVAVGDSHACALLGDGTVNCWGSGSSGTLGNGSGADSTTPVVVTGLTGGVAIAAGSNHSCALLGDGTLKCWGLGAYGALGNGGTSNAFTPVSVTGLADVVAVDVGDYHTCVMVKDGAVRCFGGISSSSLLGNGAPIDSFSPSSVTGLSGAVSISSGLYDTCIVRSDGTARCWGFNGSGEFGNGNSSSSAVPVTPTQTGIAALSIGASSTCVILADKTVRCWGAGYNGQLGNGSTSSSNSPVTVTGLGQVTSLAHGQSFVCARIQDGTIQCWGYGANGRLGNGATSDSSTFVPVTGLSSATAIALGDGHACALLSDSTVRCWGSGLYGQLGNGGTVDSSTPVTVTGLSGVVALSLGAGFSCAVLNTGGVRCWGYGGNGQLGNGSYSQSTAPVTVTGISTAIAIASGGDTSCAVLADGTVRCWGYGQEGELGDGNHSNSAATPVTVAGLGEALGISAGIRHVCALSGYSGVKCWGANQYLQLGSPLPFSVTTPIGIVQGLNTLGKPTSSVTATTPTVADGSATSTITVSLRTTTGTAWSGVVPTVAAFDGLGADVAGACSTSDAAGVSTCTLKSTFAESKKVWMTSPYLLISAIDASFTTQSAAKLVVYGPAAGNNNSCLGPFQIELQDTKGNPVAPGGSGLSIAVSGLGSASLYTGPGCATTLTTPIAVASTQTSQNFFVKDASVENLTLSFSDGTHTTGTTALAINAVATSATYSTITGSGPNLPDGTSTSTITINLRDSSNVAISGVTPTFSATGTGNAYGACSATNASGISTCTMTSTVPGTKTLSIATPISKTGGNVVFIAGASKLAFNSVPYTIFGGAVFGSQPVVGITDAGGNAVTSASDTVTLSVSSSSDCSVAASGSFSATTNPLATTSGVATFAGAQYTGSETTIYLKATSASSYAQACSNAITIASATSLAKLSLSASFVHVCATLTDGTARCWGSSLYGELGNGTVTPSSIPVTVSGLNTIVGIASGTYHSCTVLSDGTVRCWGENDYGALGNSNNGNSTTPVAVTGISTAIAVAGGLNHTCAVLADSTVRCWGFNNYGQLGDGTTTNSNVPVTVTGLSGVVAITAGWYYSCALLSDGTARCWGMGINSQLGNGGTTSSLSPVTVSGLAGAVAISAGQSHTCAILANGTGKCWGVNSNGRLGNGTQTDSSTPVTVTGLAGAVGITAGMSHSCAVLSGGTATCWGAGYAGQLGDGSLTGAALTPVMVSGLTNVIAITGANSLTCALLFDGTIRCWGQSQYGELGIGDTVIGYPLSAPTLPNTVASVGTGGGFGCALFSSPSPVTVSGLSTAVSLAVGYYESCVILSDGTVRCWGANYNGELGNGSTTNSSTPVTVTGLGGAFTIAAGQGHVCAILNDSTVRCWGSGTDGQLGNGATSDSTTPVTVTGLSKAVAISGGRSHTCALLSDGTARCWGLNTNGQLGNGTTTASSTPVTVTGLTNAVAIAAGDTHTCAILSDRTARCWGAAAYFELGNGSQTDSSIPVTVTGLTNAVAIASGDTHSCAVLADGTGRCWGNSWNGALGDGGSFTSTITTVTGLTDAYTISISGLNACVTTGQSGAKCWGPNDNGQLGDAMPHQVLTPVGQVYGLNVKGNPVSSISGTTPVTANGTAASTITVNLRNNSGAVWSGVTPTFASYNGATGNTAVACSSSDASGVSTCSLKSTFAEAKKLWMVTPYITAANSALSFTAQGANKLTLYGPANAYQAFCTGPYQVQLQDTNGNPVMPASSLPVTISGLGLGSLYSDASCLTGISNTITLATTQNSANFYFRDESLESLTVGAAATAMTSASKTLNTYSTTATHFDFPPAYDQASTGNNAAGAATYTVSATTAGTKRVLLLAVTWKNNTAMGTVPTGGPGGWTSVGSISQGTGLTTQVFRAFAASQLTASTITITVPGSAKSTAVLASFSNVASTGTNGSGAVDQFATGTNTTLNPSVSVTPASAARNTLVVGFLGSGNATAPTAGAGFALQSTVSSTGGGAATTKSTTAFEVRSSISTGGSAVPVPFTLGAIDWAQVDVVLKSL